MDQSPRHVNKYSHLLTAWDLARAWPYPADFNPARQRATTIEWTSGDGKKVRVGKIGYPIQTYVDAVGLDLAAKFLFVFGGTEVYFTNPSEAEPDSTLSVVMGDVAAGELRSHVVRARGGSGPVRLPVGREFLAKYLRSKGEPVTRIAPILRASEVSLRIFLLSDEERLQARLVGASKRVQSALAEAADIGLVELPSHHKLKPKGTAQ